MAIKVLHEDLGFALGAERFLAEIRTTARLQHPHILPLLDSGSTAAAGEPGGLLYYVMPYVAGESLRERLIREKQLPIEDALRITREVADALGHAHAQGIVHRDIKPENILLHGGHAVLADFGIALVEGTRMERLTSTGMLIGTAAYMSPEQVAADRDIGAAADQYSLGCVVYEMLSGEPPFTGSSSAAVVAKRLFATPRPLRLMRPEVSAVTGAAVTRAMARDASDRFSSIMEFARALGVAARPGDSAEEPRRSIAVLPFANLSTDPENEYFADGITEDIITNLSRISALKVISRTSVMVFKHTPKNLREIGDTLGVETVLEGSVRRAGERLRITAQLIDARSDAHLWAETYDRRLTDVFEIQSEVARSIADVLRAQLTREGPAPAPQRPPMDIEAYNHVLVGRHHWHRWTEGDLQESVGWFRRAIERDPSYAPAYLGLGAALATLSLGYWSMPAGAYRKEADHALSTATTLDPHLGEALAWRGYMCMQYDYAWERAEELLTRAIEVDPGSAMARDTYANFLTARGRYEEAREQHDRALELDPLSYFILANVVLCAHRARDHERALAYSARQLALNPDLPLGHAIAALARAANGDTAGAVSAARRSLTLGHIGDLMVVIALAAAGEREEAQRILQHCEDQRAGQNIWLMALAMAYTQLGPK